MRVALVCGTYAPERDGVADYVRRLAEELRSGPDALDVVVAARAEDGREPDGAVALAPDWSPRHLRGAARALDGLGADLLHVQWAPSAYGWSGAVGWLPALVRTPVVTTLHEYGWWGWPGWVPGRAWPLVEGHGRYDRESGLLGPRSRALVTTNAGHAEVVRRRLGREPTTIPIGPNVPGPGPDAAGARERVRARLGLADGVPLLVFFGFVHPVKGFRELVDAAALLRDEGVDVHVVGAGGFASLALPGEEARSFRAEVEQRVADRGVADRVTLTGWVDGDEVSQLLSAADLVVLPFTAGVTTKSGSLLAALAHRAPVLATVADERDADLVDGVTVLDVTARRDPAAIAAAVRRALGDPALTARVAQGGQAFAANRDWPAIAAAHRAVYRTALEA
ncbi:Glycosyltransferase involved in cell wall bisynthesis [Microlunatus sagamiharensis]|uniref:Glycosyltransferase involved in cell wall bisynthesis n=1 Tax=Microlunatus sagamiharensis TaxID=546874 RepID=A0A1H2MZ07_9ACTN|nr:glycosyltransferase [Microlunatus sagamiharensis]SDU98603.1 Glycosyltransferase involved in cell wall bisynthesis [Microlunatus sagamiharensis]